VSDTPAPRRVTVALGARSYEVEIGRGLLTSAGERIEAVLGHRRAVVVADAALEATPHLAALRRGLDAPVLTVPPGEGSKSLASFSALVEEILARRPDRRTAIVAVGGGVVGDLAGFAAATVLRGVPYVQVPTTLLAQVDSAVGGKTGINSRHGKNLIGAFHQPALVLADLATLDTLPERERRAGYAEVVKYGLLGEADFFAWLEANGARALAGDADALAHAVVTSVRAKAAIVAADEEERSGTRALLNLGHTFAHAYEALTGMGAGLLHGEAVAIGLVDACRLSARLGLCGEDEAGRVEAHLAAAGLPTRRGQAGNFAPEDVVAAMRGDKKVEAGRLTFVLVRGIGRAFLHRDVAEADLSAHLRATA
jgi:3-dehydroquinate synthase